MFYKCQSCALRLDYKRIADLIDKEAGEAVRKRAQYNLPDNKWICKECEDLANAD